LVSQKQELKIKVVPGTVEKFSLSGGTYSLVVKANGEGLLTLGIKAADDKSWVTITTISTSESFQTMLLPSGMYMLCCFDFVEAFVSISNIPY
jgi:hypothetical protein